MCLCVVHVHLDRARRAQYRAVGARLLLGVQQCLLKVHDKAGADAAPFAVSKEADIFQQLHVRRWEVIAGRWRLAALPDAGFRGLQLDHVQQVARVFDEDVCAFGADVHVVVANRDVVFSGMCNTILVQLDGESFLIHALGMSHAELCRDARNGLRNVLANDKHDIVLVIHSERTIYWIRVINIKDAKIGGRARC